MGRWRMAAAAMVAVACNGLASAGVLADRQGCWMGELKLPDGRVMRSGVEIFIRADGSAWASYASPDRGAYDLPAVSVREQGDSVSIALSFASMDMVWAGDRFKAQWKQGGKTLPLELMRVAQFPKKVRAQSPQLPLPYREEPLSIRSGDGVVLGATLTLPQAQAARPNAVVLVHGSGDQTRDAEFDGHRTFAVLADHLARQGVAVLRYDKRGVGRSTGDYQNHTQEQLKADVAAALAALRARKQFARIGLIGHSEGSMLAAGVAARAPKSVDFIVSLGGVGLPGLEMIVAQDRIMARDNGASAADVERLAAYARRFYETVLAHEEAAPRLAALRTMQQDLPQLERELVAQYKMNVGTLSLEMAGQPMLRGLLQADPGPDWRAVRSPVLLLNGGRDHQVPPENLAGIADWLRQGGNRRVEAAVLPELNHMFQTARTGAEDEYTTLEETMAPAALRQVAAFVARQR